MFGYFHFRLSKNIIAQIASDVDVMTKAGSLAGYRRLAARLRDRGFQEDHSAGAPICRSVGHGVLVDVMPTDPKILGFATRWYAKDIETARDYDLESKQLIRLVTPVLFITTKPDAFDGCGKQDHVMSHDLEDVISVLDGRPEIVADI